MNKKQAIAYAQVTLNYMQSSKYENKINPTRFGIEMNECIKLYSPSLIIDIANSQINSFKP